MKDKRIPIGLSIVALLTCGIPLVRKCGSFCVAPSRVHVSPRRALDGDCPSKEQTLYVFVRNESVRTVSHIRFTLDMREEGRSTDRDGDTAYIFDAIVPPGERRGLCYVASEMPVNAELRVDDYWVNWE